jgi:hypothetical protein
MSKVYIRRVLFESGYMPYFCEGEDKKIIGVKRYFSILADLKKYYKIKKLVKNGKGWAINSRGTKIEWIEYIAEIN